MKVFTFLIWVASAVVSAAQTQITGSITDTSGNPIPGANIYLKGTYDGTSSLANGSFEFVTSEKGDYVLTISFVGYVTHEMPIVLTGTRQEHALVLKEEVSILNAVTISAGSFTASDESRRTIFKALDVANTAGATADIAGALNTLPGTQKVGESGRLFVRGGDGSETRTFIDGLAVLDAYGVSAPNTPSRGRFLPFMFKGTSFSTGGYSAEYGQALSSALILTSHDKIEMKRTDIGIMTVGADVAHTEVWKRGSASAKIQYTDLRPYMGLISQRIDWLEAPSSLEGSGAFRMQTGKKGTLKVYQNYNHTRMALNYHDIADESVKTEFNQANRYNYTNVAWQTPLKSGAVMRGGASYTFQENNNKINGGAVGDREGALHTKWVLENSLSKQIELKAGVEHFWRRYKFNHYQFSNGSFAEGITSAFAETDVAFTNSFIVRGGLRTEYSSLVSQVSLDPRISLAYKTGRDGQFSLAYGTFRQTPVNQYVRVNNALTSEKATHYIASYQLVTNNRTFRAEAYHKEYSDLVKYTALAPSQINNSGEGYARGFELFWRDNRSFQNVDYWVSYSYLDTKRNYLNYTQAATPTFGSKHNFSVVYKHFLSRIKSQAGITSSFTSGRPYHNPNKLGFNQSQTPAYVDVSFNWSYLFKPWIIVHFSCTNVLGRDNVFGYEYATTPGTDGVYAGRAIKQAAPRFLFLGVFITLSKDKSVTQLPTL